MDKDFEAGLETARVSIEGNEDEDFGMTLKKLTTGVDPELLNRILNNEQDHDTGSGETHDESRVRHLDDAIDYSDFNELAEESAIPVEQFYEAGVRIIKKTKQTSEIRDFEQTSEQRLQRSFPAFSKSDVLRFSELFKPKTGLKRTLRDVSFSSGSIEDDLILASDQLRKFIGHTADRDPPESKGLVYRLADVDSSMASNENESSDEDGCYNFDIECWSNSGSNTPPQSPKLSIPLCLKVNDPSKLILNLNDPKIIFEVVSNEAQVKEPSRKKPRFGNGAANCLFNLSNDRFYEVRKDSRLRRIRQTFGNLVIKHSGPAAKLQTPFFKTKLSKAEARSFHRPPSQFLTNSRLHFSRVRGYKKKKTHGRDPSELLRKSKDLSFKENAPFVMLEYSEEHPPMMSNVGMCNLLVNYYRKSSEDDVYVPKMDLGEPFVLDMADASPFMNFGHVDSGQTVQALYNNMIRAPIFRHAPKPTDFILIKSSIKSDTRYFLRTLQNLFVVGQVYPVTEVPGPHSRKISNTIKNRLQVTTFRLIRNTLHQRLKMSRLSKMFPDQNDMQIRQRLKEFMEYQRKGGNSGYWQLKPGLLIPSESELRKLVTPEMVCLSESMQVGQRHLLDAGYGQTEDDDNEGDESKLDVEQQLAPWITTRNFINATQGKAMLKLHGEGDPTGAGLAFSFIRVSMKDIFLRAGESAEEKLAEIESRPKSAHRYNVAEQQQVYREEISRIWNAQYADLSNPEEPEMDTEASDLESELPAQPDHGINESWENIMSPSPSVVRGFTPDDDDLSLSGRPFVPYGGNKVLKIRRLVRTITGLEWQTEIVRDTAVINAYVRNRQMIEDQTMSAEILEPTNDEAKNRRRKKIIEDQLAKLKRNAERRMARKTAKAQKTHLLSSNGPFAQVKSSGMKRSETVRRCGNCGQLGHMKTNRQKCPMYQKMETGGASGSWSPATGVVNDE